MVNAGGLRLSVSLHQAGKKVPGPLSGLFRVHVLGMDDSGLLGILNARFGVHGSITITIHSPHRKSW